MKRVLAQKMFSFLHSIISFEYLKTKFCYLLFLSDRCILGEVNATVSGVATTFRSE